MQHESILTITELQEEYGEMDTGERSREQRDHQLWAYKNGLVISIDPICRLGFDDVLSFVKSSLLRPPYSQMFIREIEIKHLMVYGYIPDKPIVLVMDGGFLIDKPSIDGIRPPFFVEFMGYPDEWA